MKWSIDKNEKNIGVKKRKKRIRCEDEFWNEMIMKKDRRIWIMMMSICNGYIKKIILLKKQIFFSKK